jgi:glycosyltransferase involved in cell wall biosynthesis
MAAVEPLPLARAALPEPLGRRPRILLLTEGTYPYAQGGVSSWCDLLVGRLDEFDWLVLPIVAPGVHAPLYALPPHAREVGRIEVWSDAIPPGRGSAFDELPGVLVRGLLGWNGDMAGLLEAWLRCRREPAAVRRAFRSPRGWDGFLAGLADVLDERVPEAGTPPTLDLVEAATLYQTLYWVARTAAAPTPAADVLHVTAAGWSAIPALVHRALYGTPLVLTEHGVYLREAYLAAARGDGSPGARFAATRLARGLTCAAYAGADVVCPVTDANAYWEMGLGIDPARILVLYNGLRAPADPPSPPGARRVVSVGRIDPLKDVHTLLRVAAETVRIVPDARFAHYGAATDGEDAYARSCFALHERLGLGERFRFMGRTTDPHGVMREADVVLSTSISEGLPMSILEAMSVARPVVCTAVGGVPDVVRGCGVTTAPGDDHGLAMAVALLVRNPDLAQRLGRRGHGRLGRMFSETACVERYRSLLGELACVRQPLRVVT